MAMDPLGRLLRQYAHDFEPSADDDSTRVQPSSSDDDSIQEVQPSHSDDDLMEVVDESYDNGDSDSMCAQPSTHDNDEAPEKDEEKCQPNNRCGVDIGNVLSMRSKNWGCKVQAWKSADPSGAYAFCMLYCLAYGAENLFFVSRTNNGSWRTFNGKHEAWVVRFIRELGFFDMGVPEDNLKICKEYWEKGKIAHDHNLGRFIDDRFDCLMGVSYLVPDCDLWCYTNDERGPHQQYTTEYPRDAQFREDFFNSLNYCDNWRAMASNCKLEKLLNFPNYSFNDIWESLIIHGPPRKPHSEWLMNWLKDELHETVITTTIAKQENSDSDLEPGITTIVVKKEENPDSEPEHETQSSVPKPCKTTLETGRVAEFGAQPSVQEMTMMKQRGNPDNWKDTQWENRDEWEHDGRVEERNDFIEAKAEPSRPKPTKKRPSPEKPEATQHTQKKYKYVPRQPCEPPRSITNLLQPGTCQPGGSLPSTQTVHPQTAAPEANSDNESEVSQGWGEDWLGKKPDSDDKLDDEIDNHAPPEAAPATRAISWPRMPPGMPPMMPPPLTRPAMPVRWHPDGRQWTTSCKEEDMAPEAQPEATHSEPKSILKKKKRMAGPTQPSPPPAHLGHKPAAVPDDGTDRIAHRSTIRMLTDVSTPEQTAANRNCIVCSSEADALCQDCTEPVCNGCIVEALNICTECDSKMREQKQEEDNDDWAAWEQHVNRSMVRTPSVSPARTQGPEVASPPNSKERKAMEALIEAVMERKMHDFMAERSKMHDDLIMANGGDQPDQPGQRPTRTFPATAMKWAAATNGPKSKGLVTWAEKKKQRAADHQTRIDRLRSSPSAPSCSVTLNVITPTTLCAGCHKGQPGQYCIFVRCFHCCREHRGSVKCQQPGHNDDDH